MTIWTEIDFSDDGQIVQQAIQRLGQPKSGIEIAQMADAILAGLGRPTRIVERYYGDRQFYNYLEALADPDKFGGRP